MVGGRHRITRYGGPQAPRRLLAAAERGRQAGGGGAAGCALDLRTGIRQGQTLLLATGGSLHRLAVPAGAVAWGLVSALTLAFYTVAGASLLQRWPPAVSVGWAMVVGGAAMAVLAPPWSVGGRAVAWDAAAAGLWAFVVLGGTLVAFTLYLASLRHLRPSQTSLLACMEPLAAAASATLWLGVPFTGPMAAGGAAVMAAVLLLSRERAGTEPGERAGTQHELAAPTAAAPPEPPR